MAKIQCELCLVEQGADRVVQVLNSILRQSSDQYKVAARFLIYHSSATIHPPHIIIIIIMHTEIDVDGFCFAVQHCGQRLLDQVVIIAVDKAKHIRYATGKRLSFCNRKLIVSPAKESDISSFQIHQEQIVIRTVLKRLQQLTVLVDL